MLTQDGRGAQGGGEVTIPGIVQETNGRGTQCTGLIDKVVFSPRLDIMILEVFVNLNDPMILSYKSISEFRGFFKKSTKCTISLKYPYS